MEIFEKEIADGLQDKLVASASFRISAAIKPVDNFELPVVADLIDKAFANEVIKPSPDELFYFENILVTVGWNSNDDVFDRDELWAARNTPMHKPLNMEHVDRNIIGHTVSCQAVDANYKPIDEMPAEGMFHIKAGDVIYRTWHDPAHEGQIAKLVEQIRAGEWSVSMECAFNKFDYALINEKESFVLARNSDNAHITKHLRIFGGDGQYEGYKVGRLMRDMKFCGKGIVRQPANPYSVIFNKFDATAKKVVYSEIESSNGDKHMSDELKAYAADIKNLNTEVNTLSKNLSVAEGKLEIAASKEKNLAETVSTLTASVKTLTEERDSFKVKASDLESKASKLEKDLEALTATKASLETDLSKVKADISLQGRKNKLTATLIDLKVEKADEVATAFCDKHSKKDDESFAELLELFVDKYKSEAVSKKKLGKEKNGKQVNTYQAMNAALEDEDVDAVEDDADAIEGDDDDLDDDELFAEGAMAFATEVLGKSVPGLFKNLKETK